MGLSLLLVLAGMVSVQLIESYEKGCSVYCTDYHRICQAVKDHGFYNKYLQLLETGALDEFGEQRKISPAVDCTSDFYKIAYPLTCGECSFCDSSAEALQTPGKTPELLDILSGEGQGSLLAKTVITNAFDNNNSTYHKKCYMSGKNKPKEAIFKIPTAEVKNVYLLGRDDGNGRRWNMTDTVVQVCTGGRTSCNPCGRVTDTPPIGVLADIGCSQGAFGDFVLVTNEGTVKYLQICEVRVFGIES